MLKLKPVSFSVKIAVFQESSSCTKLVKHHICLVKTEDRLICKQLTELT